jgi:hypothetical protein
MKSLRTVLVSIFVLSTSAAWAAPGNEIAHVTLPVTGFGVSVANDCQGNIFYTNNGQHNLYVMDASGTLLNTLPVVDSATGAALDMDEMAWDASRQVLWGQRHNSNPIDLYTINATTGIATHAFTSTTHSLGTFRDGIAYDPDDDTLWLSGDVSTNIDHYTTAGAYLGTITPKNPGGGNLGEISGVVVGVGDLLYSSRCGHAIPTTSSRASRSRRVLASAAR